MHLHTCHSDGRCTIKDLISYAKTNQIGVAITDHNEIRGVLEAVAYHEDLLIIPGIELETLEGPHLLMYFYTPGDLQDFFQKFQKKRTCENSGMPHNIPVLECLMLAEPFDCIRVAAHPFGYFGINRGVLKCAEKNMLPGVLEHIDGIEVICGGMMENLNKKAIHYAQEHPVSFTGGSDAHILSDVGSVITGVVADCVEDFLTGIQRRENIVVGKPSGYLHKGATAGVIAWSFAPYAFTRLTRQYSFYKKRLEERGKKP